MFLFVAFTLFQFEFVHFLTYSSVSEMESMKNKQVAKNRQEEIKKAVALRA